LLALATMAFSHCFGICVNPRRGCSLHSHGREPVDDTPHPRSEPPQEGGTNYFFRCPGFPVPFFCNAKCSRTAGSRPQC
jgi:hypothetical protein